MERVRPPQPAEDSSLETIEPLPGTHSLPVLLNVVRSPGAMRSDVDALLRGLARPLADNESPRSRADFLLSLIESTEVGDMQGSQHLTVKDFAVRCLLDMGYPYALEIPPEALGGRAVDPDDERPQELPIPGLIALLAGFITQAITCVPTALELVEGRHDVEQAIGVIALGLLLLPSLMSVLGGALRIRLLQKIGLITTMLTGGIWLLTVFPIFASTPHPFAHSPIYVSLVAGLGFLLGSVFTRSPGWAAPDEAPEKDESPETER